MEPISNVIIELMEEMADDLKQWHQAKVIKAPDLTDEKSLVVPTISHNRLHIQLLLSTRFERVMECLLYHKPDLAKDVRGAYDNLLNSAEEADKENSKNKLYTANLIWPKIDAYQLAVKFLHIVKMAKEDSGLKGVTETEEKAKPVKEPSSEAMQAYMLRRTLGWSQEEVAKIMTEKHKRKIPYKQWHISRWESSCRAWLKANNLDIFSSEMTKTIITMEPNILDMGARTDGKITGDPRHKKLVDPNGDIYD